MDAELRMNEGSSLRLTVPGDAYPPEVQQVCRELTELYTLPEFRGQGKATELLENVCKEADDAGMSLLIHVKPYDDCKMESVRLQSWYARLGFVVFQSKPEVLMCRVPKKVAH